MLVKILMMSTQKGDAEPNIIENGASNMMLKKIVQKDKERAADSQAKTFSEILLNTIDEDGMWLVTCLWNFNRISSNSCSILPFSMSFYSKTNQ